jgi:site-specific DNA-methyltransferase (adenine-specific)
MKEMTFQAYHGNCLEIMKTLPDKSIDLFLCDLPYGCLTSACEWDVPIDLNSFWLEVKRLMKNEHVPVIHFCNTRFGFDLIKSKEKWFRYDLVWAKTNAVGFLSANKMPMKSHENIYVFSKAGAYYERIDISGNFPAGGGGRSSANFLPIAGMPNLGTTVAGQRCVKSVIEIANKKTKGGHPTQKPAELYKWLIERYCPKDGTVLDPTAGSFTSCKVAAELGRKAIGIEMNKDYFNKFSNVISHV